MSSHQPAIAFTCRVQISLTRILLLDSWIENCYKISKESTPIVIVVFRSILTTTASPLSYTLHVYRQAYSFDLERLIGWQIYYISKTKNCILATKKNKHEEFALNCERPLNGIVCRYKLLFRIVWKRLPSVRNLPAQMFITGIVVGFL